MKIGLKLWSTNLNAYSEEALSLFRNGVYSFLELYVVPGSLETLSGWAKLDIPFTIHCPHSAHGFNLAKNESEDSNRNIYYEVKMFADRLNADYIVFHGGMGKNVEETARQLKALAEPRAVIENKPYKALPFAGENVTCIGYTPEQIAFVKAEAQCGFCLDFNHAVCAANSLRKSHSSYIDEFMRLKPDMFHLSNMSEASSELDNHLHLDEGQLNIEKLVAAMPMNAKVTFETRKNSKTSLSDFIDDVNYVKKILERSELLC